MLGGSSPTWARRYAERSALERTNVRLNDGFRFERHAVRGRDRMAAKVGLALAVMPALALKLSKTPSNGPCPARAWTSARLNGLRWGSRRSNVAPKPCSATLSLGGLICRTPWRYPASQ